MRMIKDSTQKGDVLVLSRPKEFEPEEEPRTKTPQKAATEQEEGEQVSAEKRRLEHDSELKRKIQLNKQRALQKLEAMERQKA